MVVVERAEPEMLATLAHQSHVLTDQRDEVGRLEDAVPIGSLEASTHRRKLLASETGRLAGLRGLESSFAGDMAEPGGT
jgi:hypothetical protein